LWRLKIQSSIGAASSGEYAAPMELADFFAGGSKKCRTYGAGKTRGDF
jgi:hypothetical protein